MKTILIDADVLTYKAGWAAETPVYVCGGRLYQMRGKAEAYSKVCGHAVVKRRNISSFNVVKTIVKNMMYTLYEDLGTTKYEMFITASKVQKNFRNDIATFLPYKGNRIDLEKPFHYKRIRQLLVDEYGAILVEGQEADDAIGIAQYTHAAKAGNFDSTIIASIDKDLKALEGFHYNLTEREMIYIQHEEGLKKFFKQLLTGDGTDNIPGLTKLLKIKDRLKEANKLSYGKPGYIAQCTVYFEKHSLEECLQYVIELYNTYGFGEKELTEIGQLLWIRRKENEMWSLNHAY